MCQEAGIDCPSRAVRPSAGWGARNVEVGIIRSLGAPILATFRRCIRPFKAHARVHASDRLWIKSYLRCFDTDGRSNRFRYESVSLFGVVFRGVEELDD